MSTIKPVAADLVVDAGLVNICMKMVVLEPDQWLAVFLLVEIEIGLVIDFFEESKSGLVIGTLVSSKAVILASV
ncbi:hypothetical protein LIER_12718 [Lithospermum erythrorhizon]|uniref:Uncharacterized protein n=1 Tax=Lithospermum erythrorhizon TaxID=34254 RepID=A0AAV3PVA5_LITER